MIGVTPARSQLLCYTDLNDKLGVAWTGSSRAPLERLTVGLACPDTPAWVGQLFEDFLANNFMTGINTQKMTRGRYTYQNAKGYRIRIDFVNTTTSFLPFITRCMVLSDLARVLRAVNIGKLIDHFPIFTEFRVSYTHSAALTRTPWNRDLMMAMLMGNEDRDPFLYQVEHVLDEKLLQWKRLGDDSAVGKSWDFV